jgi:hypothetical protein
MRTFFKLAANGGNMARKGFRRAALSRYNELDAGDELRIPPRPFLAILHVRQSIFSSYINNIPHHF